MSTAVELIVWGVIAHLVADWLLQNEWMALNKASLSHPAAWVHSGIHFAVTLVVFPQWGAIAVFVTHMLIDTRAPVQWWMRAIGQTRSGPYAIPVAIWVDQVFHIMVIVAVAVAVGVLR